MAEVYWVHLPEHTDVFTQGYVGYTAQTALERFETHKKESRYTTKKLTIIHKAILKYGNNLVVDTLVVCDEEYGLYVENALRPTEKIGWNIVPGGGKPPNHTGKKRTADQNEAQRARMKESGVRPPMTPDVLLKIAKAKAENGHWGNHKVNGCIHAWEKADVIYELRRTFPKISARDIAKITEINDTSRVNHILRYIKRGFVPLQCEKWLRDFDANDLSFISGIKLTDLSIQHPWTYNRANKSLWANADVVKTLWESCKDKKIVERSFNLQHKAANTLLEKLDSGWNPQEDEHWIAFKTSYEKEYYGT